MTRRCERGMNLVEAWRRGLLPRRPSIAELLLGISEGLRQEPAVLSSCDVLDDDPRLSSSLGQSQ